MQRILTGGLIGAALLVQGACTPADAPTGDGAQSGAPTDAQTTNQHSREPIDRFRGKGLTSNQAAWLRSNQSRPAGR